MAAGVLAARCRGKGGSRSPHVGLGEDKTKDNVRGRHRWRLKARLSLKRGQYSIFVCKVKKILLRETETEREREGEFA